MMGGMAGLFGAVSGVGAKLHEEKQRELGLWLNAQKMYIESLRRLSEDQNMPGDVRSSATQRYMAAIELKPGAKFPDVSDLFIARQVSPPPEPPIKVPDLSMRMPGPPMPVNMPDVTTERFEPMIPGQQGPPLIPRQTQVYGPQLQVPTERQITIPGRLLQSPAPPPELMYPAERGAAQRMERELKQDIAKALAIAKAKGIFETEEDRRQAQNRLEIAAQTLGPDEWKKLDSPTKLEIALGRDFSLSRGGYGSGNLRSEQETTGEDIIARLRSAGVDPASLSNAPTPGKRYRVLSHPSTGVPVQWAETTAPQYSLGAQQMQLAFQAKAQELGKSVAELTPPEKIAAWDAWQKQFPQGVREVIGPDGVPRIVPNITAAQGRMPTPRTLYEPSGRPTTAGVPGISTTAPSPVPATTQEFLGFTGAWIQSMKEVEQDLYSGRIKTLGPVLGRLKMLEFEKFGGTGASPEEIDLASRLHRLITEAAFANGGKQLTITEYTQFKRLNPTLEDTVQQALIKARQSIQYLERKMSERARMLGYRQFEQLPEDVRGLVQAYKPREWQTAKPKGKAEPVPPSGAVEVWERGPDGRLRKR